MKTSVLPESYRRCLSPQDRKALSQPTIEESKKIGEARLERDLQKLIYSELLRRGLFFHYSRSDRRTTTRLGTPDFALPIHGKYVAIECKTPTGFQTQEQLHVQTKIELQGGNYHLARSFDEFLEVLKSYGL